MQSKLKSFAPVMYNGVHRSWTSQNPQYPGVNYDFTVTMENGDIGVVSSKKVEGNFSIDKEYTYEKQTDSQGRVKLKNFKSIDAAARSAYGTGRSSGPSFWDQPEVVRSTTKNISMEITNAFLSKMPATIQANITPDKIIKIANLVYSWCYVGTEEKPEVANWGKKIIERRQALQRSVEQIPLLHREIINSNDVFKETVSRAEDMVEWIRTAHEIHAPKTEPAEVVV